MTYTNEIIGSAAYAELIAATRARRARLGMLPPKKSRTQKTLVSPVVPSSNTGDAAAPSPQPPARPQPIIQRDWLNLASHRTKISIGDIQRLVSLHFGISREDLLSQRRDKDSIWPRHVAIYLACEMTDHSLPTIGRAFAGRDHTTILHARKKIAQLRAQDVELDRLLSSLKAAIRAH